MKVNSTSWRCTGIFDKIKLKHIRVGISEGHIVFALKLQGSMADTACGKLHRKTSTILKDGFHFDEDTDILTYQPSQETLPVTLGEVHQLFKKVVE